MAEEKDSVQKFYESLHNALMDELSKQDNRGDKRFERGLSTHLPIWWMVSVMAWKKPLECWSL